MKIAYLNPWDNRAENQSYFSVAAAGRRRGITLMDCRTPEDVERADPDFVLSVASIIPKCLDIPSYLLLRQPKELFLETPSLLQNLLTYDGYLTVSDSLSRFISDICFGAGRPEKPCFYVNSSQTLPAAADFPRLVTDKKLQIAYVGANRDRNMTTLLRALDALGLLRIHGPAGAWEPDGYSCYSGPLAFDGTAPQKRYAECGIGLVACSDAETGGETLSNRIFEISSVGAVALCPDTPWIRQWFGDSVLYFEPDAPPRETARQILKHYRFCVGNPVAAGEQGRRARTIFEENFSAERMLTNLISYHEAKRAARAGRLALLKAPGEPAISVIIRCGDRPIELVKSAVDSVRRQTFGRFTVIFSKYRDLDLSDITSDLSGPIVRFVELLTPGGGRSATMSAGLRALETEYFSVLDDDDCWMSDHFETLFMAGRVVDPQFDMAFSGVIARNEQASEIEPGLQWRRHIYVFGYRDEPRIIRDVTGYIGTNSFVARSELVAGEFADLPHMDSAEDSLLAAFVSRRKRPIFSYRATAFLLRGFVEQSNWWTLPSRRDDELTYQLRAGLLFSPRWLNQGAIEPALSAWQTLPPREPSPLRPARLSLLDTLGEPQLSDQFEESWELLDRMLVGNVGRKCGSAITTRAFESGHVCYGPYVCLPCGHYRIDISIAPGPTGRRRSGKVLGASIGAVDVVSVDANWEGGATRFEPADRRIEMDFRISHELVGKPVEFRVTSFGIAAFTIGSIRLRHLG